MPDGPRSGQGHVDRPAGLQAGSFCPDIRDFGGKRSGKTSLYREVPLLGVPEVPGTWIMRQSVANWLKLDPAGKKFRCLCRHQRILQNARLANQERRRFELALAVSVQLHPEDAITGSHDRILCQPVGQAEARREMVVADIPQILLADTDILGENRELP